MFLTLKLGSELRYIYCADQIVWILLKNALLFSTKFQYPSTKSHQRQRANKDAGCLYQDLLMLVIGCLIQHYVNTW